jgi:hypothetical protein
MSQNIFELQHFCQGSQYQDKLSFNELDFFIIYDSVEYVRRVFSDR